MARWAPFGSVSDSAPSTSRSIWINTLLGFVLTPLFIVPATWLMDRVKGKAPERG